MTISRWKLTAGVLGVSMAGLAAVAGPGAKKNQAVAHRTAQTPPPGPLDLPPLPGDATPAKAGVPTAPTLPAPGLPGLPDLPPAVTEQPLLPQFGVPPVAAPKRLPDLTTTAEPPKAAPPAAMPALPLQAMPALPMPWASKLTPPATTAVVLPVGGTMPPDAGPSAVVPAAPTAAVPSPFDLGPPLASPLPAVPPPADVKMPAAAPVNPLPGFTPPAATLAPVGFTAPMPDTPVVTPPTSVTPPTPATAPVVTLPATVVPAVASAAKFRILMSVGAGGTSFEVKLADDLVLKVKCDKVDIKSRRPATACRPSRPPAR